MCTPGINSVVIMYYLLLDQVCLYFVSNAWSCAPGGYLSIFSFLVMSLPYFGITVILAK